MRLAAPKDHQTDQRDACQTQQDRNREVHNRLTNLEIDNLKLRMTQLEAGQKLYEHRMTPTHNLCPQCTRNNHIVAATCHRPTTNLVTSEVLKETTTLIDQPTTQRENTPKQMVNTTKATTHQIYDRPHQDHWYNDRDNLPPGPPGVSRDCLATPQQLDLGGHIVSNNTEVRSPTQSIRSYTYKRGRPTQLLQPQGENHKNLQELRTPATGRVPSEPINVNLDCVSTLHQPFKGVHCDMNNLAFNTSDQSCTTQVHERDDYTLQVEEREESTSHLKRGTGRDKDPWETDRKQQEWQTTERNGSNLRLYGASRECLATPQQPDQKDEHPQQMTRVENSIYLLQSLAGNFNTQRRIEQMSIGSDNSHLRLDDKRLQKMEGDETHLDLYGASRESLATPQQITQEGTTTNQPTYIQGNTYKGPEAIQHHSMTNQTHFLSKGRANTETSHQTPTSSIMNHQLQREDTYKANPWMTHQVLTTCHPRERNTIPRMIPHKIKNPLQHPPRDIYIPTWKYYEGAPLFKQPDQIWRQQMAQAGTAWRSLRQIPPTRTRL